MAENVSALESTLADARLKGTPQEKIAASEAWNKARLELQKAEDDAIRHDPEMIDAISRVDTARAALDESRSELAAQRAAGRTTYGWGMGDQDRVAAPSAGGYTSRGGSYDGGGSFGGDKSVHVRGYTRADGTHVGAYDRAAPGHGSGRSGGGHSGGHR